MAESPYHSADAGAASVVTRASVEPPEQIGYSIRNHRGKWGGGGDTSTSCDPPERQSLASHFARDGERRRHGRPGIQSIGTNSRGRVHFDGEEGSSIAFGSVGRPNAGRRRAGRDVYVERGSSALEAHLARDRTEESTNDSQLPAVDQSSAWKNERKDKASDIETLGGYSSHSRVKFADDMFASRIQSSQTGGRSHATCGSGSAASPWRDRRVSSTGSVGSGQSRSSIHSQRGGKRSHQRSYLQKNAALLAAVAITAMLSTILVYGFGGTADGLGIDVQRGLAGGSHDMREPTGGIMDNVRPDVKSSLPRPGTVSADGNRGGARSVQPRGNAEAEGGAMPRVPPHLRGYYSKMMAKGKGVQGQHQQQQKMEGEAQQAMPEQVRPTVQNQTVGNEQLPASELVVPDVGRDEFKKQTEELALGTGVQPSQQKPKVDPKELARQRIEELNKRRQAANALSKANEGGTKTAEAEAKQRAAAAGEVRGLEEKARAQLQRMEKEGAEARQQQQHVGQPVEQNAKRTR